MKNADVAQAFVEGRNASVQHYLSGGGVLYSYQTAIAKMVDGKMHLLKKKFSPTTSRHQSEAKYAAKIAGIEVVEVDAL